MRIPNAERAVANWIWSGESFSPLLGRDEPLGEAEPGALTGHFAIHEEIEPGVHLLARDRLGVNKLFFAIDEDGEVHSSNFLVELRRIGFPLPAIYSVPSGHSVSLCTNRDEYRLEPYSPLRFETGEFDPATGLEKHADEIRLALESVFKKLAGALRGRRVFLTLSGGLDSTTIAALAVRYLDEVTAVTFDLIPEGDTSREDPNGDLASARKVAAFLDIPHLVVRTSTAELLELIDPVLTWGQDWRDFNVHCGLVNAALANGLRERGIGMEANEPRPVFLTGDTMNELMADYHAEAYGDREHYTLPRLGQARLRQSLVEGLDSGDREVGIFAHYGFDTIQPYAICADAYTALPAVALSKDRIKQRLIREIMGEAIPEHVYRRPKVRAQVATAAGVGGTLAALVDRGIDSNRLARRFAELMSVDRESLGQLIRGGFYRMSTVFPQPGPRTGSKQIGMGSNL